MVARFAGPNEAEIVALLEKVFPENTKKQLNIKFKILNGKFMKIKKYFM